MLQRPASTRPISRPASSTTRCAPGSPAASSSTSPRTLRSLPCAGRSSVEQRVGRGDRLEAAAVAAAANGALGADADVAELACEAGDAAMEPAVDHDAGADARRDHHVDDVREAAAGAERELGESAEVRVVVDRDVEVEPRRELARRRSARPSRAGSPSSRRCRRARSAPRAPSRRRPRATRSMPASASTASTSSAAASKRGCGSMVDVELERAARRARSRRGRRRRRGGGGGRSGCRRRRPPTGRAAAGSAAAPVRRRPGGGGCSTTSPRPCSSVTSVATVVRERPVAARQLASARRATAPQRVDHAQPVELPQGLQRSERRHRHALSAVPASLSRECSKSAVSSARISTEPARIRRRSVGPARRAPTPRRTCPARGRGGRAGRT